LQNWDKLLMMMKLLLMLLLEGLLESRWAVVIAQ
jgi:hypothetical protein